MENNIWSSTSTLTGGTGSGGFERPPSSSLLRSTLTLNHNSNTAATLRSSSGYSSATDFSSSWSPRLSLVSAVKLAGFGFGDGDPIPTRASSYVEFGNNGGTSSSVSSFGGNSTSSGSHRPRPVIQYQRTLSGGAQFRSTSADPDYTNNFRSGLLTRQHGNQIEPDWTNRSASVERHFEKSCSSLLLSSSNLGLNNTIGSCSSVVTSVEQGPSERRSWITPVTELARNVSAYDWEKEKSVLSHNNDELSSVSSSQFNVTMDSGPIPTNQNSEERSDLVTLTNPSGIEQVYSRKRNQKEISFLEPEDELTLARVSGTPDTVIITSRNK